MRRSNSAAVLYVVEELSVVSLHRPYSSPGAETPVRDGPTVPVSTLPLDCARLYTKS